MNGLGIDSGVRQGRIMSSWPFKVYMEVGMKDMKIWMGRRGERFLEEGIE